MNLLEKVEIYQNQTELLLHKIILQNKITKHVKKPILKKTHHPNKQQNQNQIKIWNDIKPYKTEESKQ